MTMQYKILIVDDEKEILKALESAFLTTNFEVHTADNPIKALGLIKKKHFHIVISDIAMPQMSGLKLLKKIKEYNPFIQVIIITGYITTSNALKAFRYGASDCFFKPFDDINKIIQSVKECASKMERINSFLNEVASFDQLRRE